MASGSSGSKMTPLKAVEELKKQLTPEQYKQRLQEQLNLAHEFEAQAPAMTGFKMASSSNPRLDQQRALNLYRAKLKEEIHEDEVPHGEGFARPVDAVEDAVPENDEEQQQTKKKKKRKKAEEREEKQDDLQDEEMEPQQEADEKKKKKKRKKRRKKERKKRRKAV